jgi:hypothetical protein
VDPARSLGAARIRKAAVKIVHSRMRLSLSGRAHAGRDETLMKKGFV